MFKTKKRKKLIEFLSNEWEFTQDEIKEIFQSIWFYKPYYKNKKLKKFIKIFNGFFKKESISYELLSNLQKRYFLSLLDKNIDDSTIRILANKIKKDIFSDEKNWLNAETLLIDLYFNQIEIEINSDFQKIYK